MASLAGSLHGIMTSTPRVTYAMAERGDLPAWFARVHPRFETPANSILFFAVLAAALAISGSFVWLAVISTLARMIVYAVTIAALPRAPGQAASSRHRTGCSARSASWSAPGGGAGRREGLADARRAVGGRAVALRDRLRGAAARRRAPTPVSAIQPPPSSRDRRRRRPPPGPARRHIRAMRSAPSRRRSLPAPAAPASAP